MLMLNLFWKNKKNVINLASEPAQIVIKVKIRSFITHGNNSVSKRHIIYLS